MKAYDVAICGGGLAGLCLARQLRREQPQLSIVVIEKSRRPLPQAAFKVGESSVEVGAYYLAQTLGLQDYLDKVHLPKLGLRFFFGDAAGPLEDRPEFGEARFPQVSSYLPSYQLDRGVLEQDLRVMNEQAGIELIEGSAVAGIELGRPHVVRHAGGEMSARWVVDALGRRRLLQTQLGLKKASGHRASAAWFRFKGRLDLGDLVPASCRPWHERVPGRARYFSTNHLMGPGYWVWFIPLGSGHTSVGIVADERLHPFKGYSNFALAGDWLRKHEPRAARRIEGLEPLDFKGFKEFSYSSTQAFSSDQWACVGEAAAFSDPFYSPGSDYIAMGNTITAELIKTGGTHAEHYNRLYLTSFEITLEIYRDCYPIFGHAQATTAKLIWDWALYWGITAPIFLHGLLTRPDLGPRVLALLDKTLELQRRMQGLFRKWGSRPAVTDVYGFLVPLDIRLLRDLRLELRYPCEPERALTDLEARWSELEALAQAASAMDFSAYLRQCGR